MSSLIMLGILSHTPIGAICQTSKIQCVEADKRVRCLVDMRCAVEHSQRYFRVQ